jgi:hypothetical protein
MLLRRGSPRVLLTLTVVELNSLVLANQRTLPAALRVRRPASFANIRIANHNLKRCAQAQAVMLGIARASFLKTNGALLATANFGLWLPVGLIVMPER